MKFSTISGHISNVTRNVRTFHASVLLVEDPETSYIIFFAVLIMCLIREYDNGQCYRYSEFCLSGPRVDII